MHFISYLSNDIYGIAECAFPNVRYPCELKELKVFFGHSNGFDYIYELDNLFQNPLPIETLHLSHYFVPQFGDCGPKIASCYIFSKFSKLKELLLEDVIMEKYSVEILLKLLPNISKLHVKNIKSRYIRAENEIVNEPFTKDEILNAIKTPNKLTYLSLHYQNKFIFNEDDFKNVLKIVRNRNGGTNLIMKIGKHCKLNVSNGIIEKNKKWLIIEYDDVFGE